MPRTTMLAALAAAALALTAPAARAGEPAFGCDVHRPNTEVAGSGYEVLAYGHVAHAAGGEVSIYCSAEEFGAEIGRTIAGSGTAVAVTAGRLTFTPTDDVVICATATVSGHGVFRECHPHDRTRVPPPEVVDALNAVIGVVADVLTEHVDPPLCAVLSSLAGSYGPLTVDGQGDVYVLGEWFWDCAPYGVLPLA